MAYFCLQPGWSVHSIHELELIEADLARGAEVHVIPPGSMLRFSDIRPWSDFRKHLHKDMRRFRDGISMLSAPVELHSFDSLVRSCESYGKLEALEWPTFTDHEMLNAFRFESHDCGNAVRSSLISHTRNTAVDLSGYEEWLRTALDSSIRVYLAAKAFIARYEPETVCVFNGRMATFRGVLRASQEAGVECLVHEMGATLDRIGISVNTMPHDIHWIQQEIQRHWEGCESKDQARRIGRSFYQRKRDKEVFSGTVYTANQEVDRLPPEIDGSRTVYSVFTSSEFERFALPQYYRYLIHESQLEGILDLVRILKDHRFDGVLCVRIHPNSAEEQPSLLEALRQEVKDDFVVIAPADSTVDTYALIDASEKVFTFGSTVAMEAAFWGKPSVSFATTPYDNLDVIQRPVDREDAIRLVVEELEPRASEDCLKYGYYYSTFGRQLRFSDWRHEERRKLAFKGEKIRKSNPYRWARHRYRRLRGDVR